MDRLKKISILAVIALSAASFAFADETGRFISVEGKVDLLKAGQAEAVPVATDDIVSAGDIIRTKSLSKAEVRFSDNSSLKIGENSRVQIKEYSVESGKRTSGSILLERGNIRATVSKASGKNDFKIETPNATGSVKGTDLFVVFQKSATSVLVVNGKFSVANLAFPDKAVDVTSGNTTLVPADEPPQAPREYLALEKNSYETSTEPTVPKALALKKEAGKAAVAEGYSAPGEMKAKVIAVSGSVRVRSRGSLTWHDAKANDLLGAGDTIETKDDGKIEIRTDNGNAIDLKPDSQLVLKELTEDQKNGEYQNLFESKYGKLRAKVGKLKGNSKFEVKTPTAVAAVRGTIMFLNILPGLTSTYFEEGNGYVTSLVSNISKIVAAGSTSSADSSGKVTDPHPASDSERSSWQEGWGGGAGAEGYSPPNGGTGGGDTGGENGKPDTITGGIDNNTAPFDNKPVTDLTDIGGGTTPGETTPETYFNAELTLGTTLAEWPNAGKDIALTGTYSDPDNQKLLWNDITGNDADNGSFKGWVSGSWHSWEGVFSSIYIDATGKAGYFGNVLNYLSGTYTGEGAGNVTASGKLFVIPYANLTPGVAYNIEEGAGSGNLNLSLSNSGSLNATYDRAMKRIAGENWGIWKESYSGSYYTPEGLTAGDDGRAYWNSITGGRYNVNGYSLTAIEGSDDLNGSLIMGVLRTYLDYDHLGVNYGTILGDYNAEKSLQAIGLGGFVEAPLTFSGYWGVDSLYYNDGGNISRAGEEYGLIGSIAPNWWNSGKEGFPIVAMGEYNIESPSDTGRYIWNSPIQSQYNNTTIGGGAFFGFTTGIWNNGTMDGKVAALYIDPSNNTGILTGDLSGDYYSDISMWMATGTLIPASKSYTDIAPEDFVSNIENDSISNSGLYGYFTDADGNPVERSYIKGWQVEKGGYSYHIAGDDHWGIFDIKLGSGNYFYNPDPENNTGWSAVMGGTDYGKGGTSYWITNLSGTWQNNEIRGDISGNILSYDSLGTISGDLFGVNKRIGSTWVAAAIGTWSEEPLAWSAEIDAAYNYYSYDDEAVYYSHSNHYGIIGATASPFESPGTPVGITLMGETYPYGDIAWWGYLEGSYAGDRSTIPDGGGFIAGRTNPNTNSIDGALVTLYIDPSGNAGTLSGNFSGEHYPDINMWQASGTMTATQRATGYYDDGVEWWTDGNSIDGYFNGAFNTKDGGEIYNNNGIRDISWGYLGSYTTWLVKDGAPEPWGIYNIELGGYYDPSTSDDWTLAMGGNSWTGKDSREYWLATVKGNQWSDRMIAGTLTGKYLTNAVLGTINGDLFGGFDTYDSGMWEAVAIGTFEEKPLAFSGSFDNSKGAFGSYVPSVKDIRLDNGSITGLLGGTEPFGETPVAVTLMGEYYNPWNNKLWGINISGSTIDGTTTFLGTAGGIALNNTLKGGLLGLYIRDTGEGYRAGYISSSDELGKFAYINGNFYPSINMFDASGSVTAYLDHETSVSPDWLLTGKDDAGNSVLESDNFNGIIGGNIKGTLRGESINIVDQNWGLWKASSGGTYDSVPNGNWDAVAGVIEKEEYSTRYSIVFLDGGAWGENGEINGTINGRSLSYTDLGEISGYFIGDYGKVTWEALSFGVHSETPLAFSGLAGNNNPNLIYYDEIPGIARGLLGSVDTEWWNPAKSFEVVAMGDYDIGSKRDSYLWQAPIESYNAGKGATTTTLDGKGAFSGWTSAIFGGGDISNMKTVAIYIAPGETAGHYDAGILKGNMEGNTYASPSEYTKYASEPDREVGMWDADGTWTPTVITNNIGIDPSDLQKNLILREAALMGLGSGAIINKDAISGDIISTGVLSADFILGDMMSIRDHGDWGIIQATVNGQATVSSPNTGWSMAIGGMTVDKDFVPDGYILATAKGGAWSGGQFDGTLKGVRFTPGTDTFEAGKLTGDVVGSYQQGPVDTTFQAGMVGEWVDLAELSTDALGFDNEALANMVSVPITETYSNLLTGGAGPGAANAITNMTMDMSMYASAANALSGIWASIINGNYNGTPSPTWTVSLNNGADNVNLAGSQWVDGKWVANVTGTVNNATIAGQAGGTYATDGTLTGVGAGTWTK